jgi:hypothetical protein
MSKKKKGGHKSKKIPMAATAGAAIYGYGIYQGWLGKNGSGPGAVPGIRGAQYAALGIDNNGQFHLMDSIKAVAPVIVGAGISIMASKLGINRKLAKVPLFNL